MIRAVEVRVSGEVQGVSFRAYAAREAVEEMLTWCRQGSPSAQVHRVEVRDVPTIENSEFTVRY